MRGSFLSFQTNSKAAYQPSVTVRLIVLRSLVEAELPVLNGAGDIYWLVDSQVLRRGHNRHGLPLIERRQNLGHQGLQNDELKQGRLQRMLVPAHFLEVLRYKFDQCKACIFS